MRARTSRRSMASTITRFSISKNQTGLHMKGDKNVLRFWCKCCVRSIRKASDTPRDAIWSRRCLRAPPRWRNLSICPACDTGTYRTCVLVSKFTTASSSRNLQPRIVTPHTLPDQLLYKTLRLLLTQVQHQPRPQTVRHARRSRFKAIHLTLFAHEVDQHD